MKKKFLIAMMALFLLIPRVYASEDPTPNAKSSLLMEASTGKIIYEKNRNEKLAVASMTKMVGQIIILEYIEAGELSWSDKVTASKNASGMGGSQIYLETGEVMTVEELFKGIVMASANDATVAMAERIAGTEEKFVEMMNKKVKDLGLKDTVFKNATGLDEEGHYSTAYDMAVIARELLKHETVLKYTSIYEDYLRVDSNNKFWLVNTNKLIRFYAGADGLKTGFTDAAGYCMAVTAKRNDTRLIAIVLGEKEGKVRNNETMALLDYGFNNYQIDLLKSKDEVIDTIQFEKGDTRKTNLYLEKDATILKKISEQSLKYDLDKKINEVKLPLKKGDVVGKMYIKLNDEVVDEINIVTREDVNKINIFNLFLRVLKDTLYPF